MRTMLPTVRRFAPPHIKAFWRLFGAVLGGFAALLMRPGARDIVAQEVAFSFNPSLITAALNRGGSDLYISDDYIKTALSAYLKAHPDDADAVIAGIRMGATDPATAGDSLYTRLLSRQAQENSPIRAGATDYLAISAFLLRNYSQNTGGAVNGSPGSTKPAELTRSLIAEVARRAAKEEPNNAYFLLYDYFKNERGEPESPFLRISQKPGDYFCNRYMSEELAAVVRGVRRACGDVIGSLFEQSLASASSDTQTTSYGFSALERARLYERKSDFRTAVAIRQGVIQYARALMQSEEPFGGGADGQGLMISAFPPGEKIETGNVNALGGAPSIDTYVSYLKRHGFAKEAEWARNNLGASPSSFSVMSLNYHAMVPVYWLGAQWLGMSALLCFLAASAASAIAYRNRFLIDGVRGRRESPNVSAFLGALLALAPFLEILLLGQRAGSVPSLRWLTLAHVGIAVLLGALMLATRKPEKYGNPLLGFLCAAVLIRLSATFALGLMQSAALWLNVQSAHAPQGYDHYLQFVACWMIIVAPVALAGACAAGFSLVKSQRNAAPRVCANVYFPFCMVFLGMFTLLTLQLERTSSIVASAKTQEAVQTNLGVLR